MFKQCSTNNLQGFHVKNNACKTITCVFFHAESTNEKNDKPVLKEYCIWQFFAIYMCKNIF